ncbi:EF-hand domain-containing protein [Cinnamomum micranthum f. kanehirae]|uniref:EF-hand domain-containing protein n=1 Tax=Cinnamomum micranthum f. kanehirae TaxID=337451 RepID=A0A3S3N4A3_9MAGN|nr:EF-hand domain-containing protein [Cinnamomum micranthum f. kanehirae]
MYWCELELILSEGLHQIQSASSLHAPWAPNPKQSLTRPSPSFRLRNPSLNSLRLRRIFDVFDSNGDGFITVHELSRALEQLGLEADPAELESTIRSYIKPGNLGLEYEDFESLHGSLGDSLFGGECDSGVDDRDLEEAF